MTKKRKIVRTDILDKQIDDQLFWYVENSDDPSVPERFLDAVESSIKDIWEWIKGDPITEGWPMAMAEKDRERYRRPNGYWKIKDFLIPDYDWRGCYGRT